MQDLARPCRALPSRCLRRQEFRDEPLFFQLKVLERLLVYNVTHFEKALARVLAS